MLRKGFSFFPRKLKQIQPPGTDFFTFCFKLFFLTIQAKQGILVLRVEKEWPAWRFPFKDIWQDSWKQQDMVKTQVEKYEKRFLSDASQLKQTEMDVWKTRCRTTITMLHSACTVLGLITTRTGHNSVVWMWGLGTKRPSFHPLRLPALFVCFVFVFVFVCFVFPSKQLSFIQWKRKNPQGV